MFDRLLKSLPTGFTRDSTVWVFLSSFDIRKKLIESQGVVHTDQRVEDTMNSIRQEFFEKDLKNIKAVAVDIITDTVEIHDLSTLWTYDPQEFGFIMIDTDDDLSGVILPRTQWITDAKHALRAMKKKYGLHGKVEVIAFRTQRSIVAK